MDTQIQEYLQGLLQLQAWVCLGFYIRAADFYEWFIHKMCILDTEILKKCLITEENEQINQPHSVVHPGLYCRWPWYLSWIVKELSNFIYNGAHYSVTEWESFSYRLSHESELQFIVISEQ